MSGLIAVVALIVSAAAVFVSATQADTARLKLRYDLFERRFKVFEAYYRLIGACMGSGEEVDDWLKAAIKARAESNFLFPPDIPIFLAGLDKEVMRLAATRKMVRDPSCWLNPADRTAAALKLSTDTAALDGTFPHLVAKLGEHLHLDDRSLQARLFARLRL